MSREKLRNSLENLGRAVARLEEAVKQPDDNPLLVDGTIQRFEFAWEVVWKTLKRALLEEGIETRTPREALEGAYQAGWLRDEVVWLAMMKDRNDTSHAYDEAMARKICERIRERYFPELRRCHSFLQERFGP